MGAIGVGESGRELNLKKLIPYQRSFAVPSLKKHQLPKEGAWTAGSLRRGQGSGAGRLKEKEKEKFWSLEQCSQWREGFPWT